MDDGDSDDDSDDDKKILQPDRRANALVMKLVADIAKEEKNGAGVSCAQFSPTKTTF